MVRSVKMSRRQHKPCFLTAHVVRCKFQKRGLFKAVEGFCVKSRYPVFLA